MILEREQRRESERNIGVREKHGLPPVGPPAGDRTCNFLVHRTKPTEPPGQRATLNYLNTGQEESMIARDVYQRC